MSDANGPDGWVANTADSLGDMSKLNIYMAAWYFSVMTLTTIGYGDVTPTSNIERLVASFMMLAGALFYAYVISSVTDIVQELNKSERTFLARVDKINEFFEVNNIPREMRVRCRAYLRSTHAQSTGANYEEVMHLLSPDLQSTLAQGLHNAWGTQSDYFYNAPLSFFAKAAAAFEERAFPPGEQILDIGQSVSDLLILRKGMVLTKGKIVSAKPQTPRCLAEDILFWDPARSDVHQSPYVIFTLAFALVNVLTSKRLQILLDEYADVKEQVRRASIRNLLRINIFTYASAARLRDGLPPLPSSDLVLLKSIIWKLDILQQPGADAAVRKLQRMYRGRQSRGILKKAMFMNNLTGEPIRDLVKSGAAARKVVKEEDWWMHNQVDGMRQTVQDVVGKVGNLESKLENMQQTQQQILDKLMAMPPHTSH